MWTLLLGCIVNAQNVPHLSHSLATFCLNSKHIFSCATFSSETVSSFGWSFQKASSLVAQKAWYLPGIQSWSVRWLLILLSHLHWVHLQASLSNAPRVGSGVVCIDPFCFLAGCRTRRLNQVWFSFISYHDLIVSLLVRAPFYVLLIFVGTCSV